MNEQAKMQLAGSSWTLVSFETDTGVIPTVTKAPVTLSGSSGCNRYFASYTLTGDRIQIGPIGATRMMCNPERMDQEVRFFQALSAAERCELSKGQLLIVYTGGTLRFAPTTKVAGGSTQP
jgi:heat shock protein HslJ